MSDGQAIAGSIAPGEIPACEGFTTDVPFEALEIAGRALGRVYGVWGLSDDDIYVALGIETGSWPNSSGVAAVAHWDGHTWSIDSLPTVTGVTAISGRSGSDLWLAAIDAASNSFILRNAGGAGWTKAVLAEPTLFDLLLLPPNDGFLTGLPTRNLGPGVVKRLKGDWQPMDTPPFSEPYCLQKLRGRDAQHVQSVAFLTGARMGRSGLGSFDGTAWSVAELPEECGHALQDMVALEDGTTYTMGIDFGDSRDRKVCRQSSDRQSWSLLAHMPWQGAPQAIVATATGAVVATWADYMAKGNPTVVATFRQSGASACALSPGLGNFVSWSAPGSSKVHIFAGLTAGNALQRPGKHFVKSF